MPQDSTAPPLGAIPRYLWVEARLAELEAAIDRYITAHQPFPEEWATERNDHLAWLQAKAAREEMPT